MTVNLGVTALVNKLSDGLEVDLSVGDVWADKVEHLLGSLGDSDEDTVVDLEETEKLEDLLGLGGDLGDTGQVSHAKSNRNYQTYPFSLTTK